MSELTIDERATNYATMRHIERVRNFLNRVVADLLRRAEEHDQSKMEPPEVAAFTKYTPRLASSTYGDDRYKSSISQEDMKRALEHHYAKNSHHPEHFKDGVNDMSILDLVEMLVDWKAASERHHNGNLRKSIEVNADRFGLSPQLVRILENTAPFLERE